MPKAKKQRSEVEEAVDKFVSAFLHPSYLPSGKPNIKPGKIIHCSPWGTHLYQPWEVAVMDTPLVQRLRQIHQTAMSLHTFPSSTHSRFEHTLGVIHQASRLFDALCQKWD